MECRGLTELLVTKATPFHHHDTLIFSPFIKLEPCRKNGYVAADLMLMKLALRLALVTREHKKVEALIELGKWKACAI